MNFEWTAPYDAQPSDRLLLDLMEIALEKKKKKGRKESNGMKKNVGARKDVCFIGVALKLL